MKGLAEGMHVTTNNIANISTIGFKQQNILFSDTLYQSQAGIGNWWNAQEDSRVAIGQVGMGLQIEDVRTIFKEGAIQSTNTMTDLAINGKGFFQVSDDSGNTFYTRAGDFRQDADGVWRMPSGLALNGYELGADGSQGALAPVKVDKFATIGAKATTGVELTLNLSSKEDASASEENPYFGLFNQYDATASKSLASSAYTSAQAMTLYDAEGNAHQVTAYFDGAPTPNGSTSRFQEFIIADESGIPAEGEKNAGDCLLMSGVLEFDSTGKLINVSAFTPAEAGSKDLTQWTTASLSNGNPVMNLNGSEIGVNFGLSAAEGWVNAPANAAAVGKDVAALPGLGENAIQAAYPTTAFASSSMVNSYKQDGYEEGYLTNVSISNDGIVTGTFSNSQTLDLWEIPVARFVSEDGLYREGGNLFSATEDSGPAELGRAGTENYGNVLAYNIENSNVDMATEMVNMIVNQRGFQSNSKVVTTADEMLRKALELKR